MIWTVTEILPESDTPSGKRLCCATLTDGRETRTESFYLREGDDFDAVIATTLARWNAKRAEQDAAQARQQARTGLREAWDGLPDWLREPFNPALDAVNVLLDEGKYETAVLLIGLMTAPESYSAEQRQVFTAVKAQFVSGIQSLAT